MKVWCLTARKLRRCGAAVGLGGWHLGLGTGGAFHWRWQSQRVLRNEQIFLMNLRCWNQRCCEMQSILREGQSGRGQIRVGLGESSWTCEHAGRNISILSMRNQTRCPQGWYNGYVFSTTDPRDWVPWMCPNVCWWYSPFGNCNPSSLFFKHGDTIPFPMIMLAISETFLLGLPHDCATVKVKLPIHPLPSGKLT